MKSRFKALDRRKVGDTLYIGAVVSAIMVVITE